MRYATEIDKLASGLVKMGVPFKFRTLWDGFQILTDDWDAVCHSGSYGHEHDLLEIYGSIVHVDTDEVEGWLTANEVLARLI